ncbi:MAG: hypothetical protein EA344_05195, partial [Alkalicoccus sp.]
MKLQVYFQTEDQAEDAAASIRKYRVQDVLVDRIPESNERDMALIPASGIGTPGSAHPGQPGVFTSAEKLKDSFTNKNNPQYILEFDVDPEQKKKVLEEIKKTEGMVDEKINK